ncbi:NASP-related protein sim3-like [Brassica napus]|uniref:NASP-related protein sim3-like n=1 Tax=Brassica napus TaxID=3708 RepID=UPI0020790025|nr:NASP-related protein sim3-like [Brassica napus]XP_022555742.2 NASP-related protein sim3-like [Brassica napus]
MVDEAAASASEASVTEVAQTLEPNQASIEATVESVVQGGAESSCNNNNNNNAAESAVTDVVSEEDREKTLEFADELTEKGSVFLKEMDFAEAVDCFSRALEIRVAHYGELAAECVNAYYKYGSALLEKAQAEADPLGNMPKKEGETQQESSYKNTANGEPLAASVVSSDPERQGSSSGGQEGSGGQEQGGDGEDSQDDDLSDADADEDESDLDMAWKMLDIARAITDKQATDTMEKVDILSTLAEISLEREDIETSLSDYKNALSILERLVEPDSRHTAELNFRICICLETGCQPKEAIPYCQKALLICKARMERLTNEIKGPSASATSSTVSEIEEGIQQSSNVPYIDKSASDKEAEIGVLSGLAEDLEKKLEDLKQQAENPKQLLAELMGMASAKPNAGDKVVPAVAGEMSSSRMGTANNGKDLESPTVSTAHTVAAGGGTASSSGVTHLGVVGRGVKRVLMNATSAESSPAKKLAPESSNKADGNSS